MRRRCVRRTTGRDVRLVLAAVQHWPRQPAVAADAVELRIPAAADGDIQPAVDHIRTLVRTQAVHLPVDTVEPAVDTVIVVGTVEVPEVDLVSVLEQDTHEVRE